jgi:hypothetical protein
VTVSANGWVGIIAADMGMGRSGASRPVSRRSSRRYGRWLEVPE